MHIRCPHCRNPVEMVADAALDDVSCPSCGSSFNLIDDETLDYERTGPRRLGQFTLDRRLGVGAFGAVWEASDSQLDRRVAIKVPRKGQLDESECEFFLREARAAAQLKHPHIVTVHEVGREDGTVYIVSDLVEGVTLTDWLTARRPTADEAARICETVARALHHAHEQGVIHRDLKPGNIMMTSADQPHVMDFGLAKREAGEITMTVDGQILGTPAYMAPEQAGGDGHGVDRRADVYSLGVILFELLTGERPFRGNTRMLLHQVLHDEPPSPRQLNGGVPLDLETICLKCLQKAPDQRFTSALELADDLKRFQDRHPIKARPVPWYVHAWRWRQRNPRLALAMGALTASLLIVISLLWARNAALEAAKQERAERLEDVQAILGDMLSALTRDPTEGFDAWRGDLLRGVVSEYDQFVKTFPHEDQLITAHGKAHGMLADIYRLLGRNDEASNYYQSAIEILETGGAEAALERRVALRAAVSNHGVFQRRLGSLTKAEALFRRSIRLGEELRDRAPEQIGNHAALAGAHQNLANVLSDAKQMAVAEKEYLAALAEFSRLVVEDRDRYLRNVAMVKNNLGVLYRQTGRLEEARRCYGEALTARKECFASKDYDRGLARDVFVSHKNLGLLLKLMGENSAAEEHFRRALEISRRLVRENPATPMYTGDVVQMTGYLGSQLISENRMSELRSLVMELKQECAQLQSRYPTSQPLQVLTDELNGMDAELRNGEEREQ